MWQQLENKGEEETLAIISSVGWEAKKKTVQVEAGGGWGLVPQISLGCWGQLLTLSLQWYSPRVQPTLPRF